MEGRQNFGYEYDGSNAHESAQDHAAQVEFNGIIGGESSTAVIALCID